MSKNPFKTNANAMDKINQWGTVKFKPVPSKFYNFPKSKNEGAFRCATSTASIRLNRTGQNVTPHNGTPWVVFKNDILLKYKEEDRKRIDIKSDEAHKFIESRGTNNKKSILLNKPKEPKIWEDFQDDAEKDRKMISKGKKLKKRSRRVSRNINSKQIVKNLIKPEMLVNFDSRKLTSEQNNKLRRLITKATMNLKGTNLSQAVENLTRNAEIINKQRP